MSIPRALDMQPRLRMPSARWFSSEYTAHIHSPTWNDCHGIEEGKRAKKTERHGSDLSSVNFLVWSASIRRRDGQNPHCQGQGDVLTVQCLLHVVAATRRETLQVSSRRPR